MMLEKVLGIIAEQLRLDIDAIAVDSDITRDLGADSLDIIELADRFEKEFGMVVSDEDIMEIKTPEDIINYISGYGARVRSAEHKNVEQIGMSDGEPSSDDRENASDDGTEKISENTSGYDRENASGDVSDDDTFLGTDDGAEEEN